MNGRWSQYVIMVVLAILSLYAVSLTTQMMNIRSIAENASRSVLNNKELQKVYRQEAAKTIARVADACKDFRNDCVPRVEYQADLRAIRSDLEDLKKSFARIEDKL